MTPRPADAKKAAKTAIVTSEEMIDYDLAKSMARDSDTRVRQCLAARADVRPELLYFLASDQSPEVRREIAANSCTPRQADLLLSRDSDPVVRTGLARKIARLVPTLPQERLDQLERMAFDILETLARDQTTEVRRILAEELQSVTSAPSSVINLLARDIELSVCGPVLRNSPILTDDDILEIIIGGTPNGALSAIAQRSSVGATLADAIAASNDDDAITVLLGNASAQIREETLDRIIDRAPQQEMWHAHLVNRPQLQPRAAARLASFVADALLQVLQTRTDLGLDAARQIADSVRSRLSRQGAAGTAPNQAGGVTPSAGSTSGPNAPSPFDPPWAAEGDPPAAGGKGLEKPAERAKRLKQEGKLDEGVVRTALGEGDRGFVIAALAELVGIPAATIDRVMATHNARAVTALVWRSGLSMRLAHQIQLRLAQIPPKDALTPRDGNGYPLSERDMRWQLEFFSIS